MTPIAHAGAASHEDGELACHRLAQSPSQRASAPSAYLKAMQEKRWGKVKALHPRLLPFVQRPSSCRETSDGKSR